MTSRFSFRAIYALPLILPIGIAASAVPGEKVTLEDGTTCTIIESSDAVGAAGGSGVSSSVTAGSGGVSGSTTINGQTTTVQPQGGTSASSSASSSVTTGGAGESFSTTSITRADGTIITRNSDGTCAVTKPKS